MLPACVLLNGTFGGAGPAGKKGGHYGCALELNIETQPILLCPCLFLLLPSNHEIKAFENEGKLIS